MPFWDRWGKVWASGGTVAEPTAGQAQEGFAFLGKNPPTRVMFNAVLAWLDRKDNFLFGQLEGVRSWAGQVPLSEAGGDFQLGAALRAIFNRPPSVWGTAGDYELAVWPNTTRVAVLVVGAGGGATGCDPVSLQAGSHGGGGGWGFGYYPVNPGSRVPIKVGRGGLSSPGQGGDGGVSSFGNLLSATGGLGGYLTAGGAGGYPIGHLLGGNGSAGSDGHNLSVPAPNGRAGASLFGGGVRGGDPTGISAEGVAGLNANTIGGGGAAPYGFERNTPGGRGAQGLVVAWPMP